MARHEPMTPYRRPPLLLVVLGAATFIGGASSLAQEKPAVSGFELRPGVVVDSRARVGYVMNAERGIDKVDLLQGRLLWSTKQAARPLALAGPLLVCQAESTRAGRPNELRILALDAEKGGEPVSAARVELPAGAQAQVDEAVDGSFTISARIVDGNTIVSWQDSRHPAQGIPPDTLESSSEKGRETTGTVSRVIGGSFRFNVKTGATAVLKPGEVPTAVKQPADVPAQERLRGVSGTQFLSADSRHVLSSERTADDAVWEKYRWIVYDRGTSKQVGESTSHRSWAPFFVLDSQLICETGPYVRRVSDKVTEEPLKIHAIDLKTGRELWSHPIRDTAYRGPFPP